MDREHLGWRIEWTDDGFGVATYKTGASFNVSRSGWVAVREDAGQSDEDQKGLIACLAEMLLHLPKKGDAIH